MPGKDIDGIIKKWTVDPTINTGISISEKHATLSGPDAKSFVLCYDKSVTIGGDAININNLPGSLKFGAGLFHMSGFPMNMLGGPVTPPLLQIDPEIILTVLDVAESVVDMAAVIV